MRLAVPTELDAAVAAIKAWADNEPLISRVIIFGSRLRQTHRPDSDLDIAVSLASPEGEMLLHWIDNKGRWERDLSLRVGLAVDLDFAQPALAPRVWGYLQSGCAEVYRRLTAT